LPSVPASHPIYLPSMHSQVLRVCIFASLATAALAQSLPSTATGYTGCYVDAGSTGTRTLNYAPYTTSNNTNEMCQPACFDAGYAYSGSEYGIQVGCAYGAQIMGLSAHTVLLREHPRHVHGERWRLQRGMRGRPQRDVRRELAADSLLYLRLGSGVRRCFELAHAIEQWLVFDLGDLDHRI
jgi:hypothetical protein